MGVVDAVVVSFVDAVVPASEPLYRVCALTVEVVALNVMLSVIEFFLRGAARAVIYVPAILALKRGESSGGAPPCSLRQMPHLSH